MCKRKFNRGAGAQIRLITKVDSGSGHCGICDSKVEGVQAGWPMGPAAGPPIHATCSRKRVNSPSTKRTPQKLIGLTAPLDDQSYWDRGQELPLILVGGWSKIRYMIRYDQPGIPVLPASHPLARLYIQEAHELDHGGVYAAVMRSRKKVWIIQGARVAKQLISKCFKCKLIHKPLQEQKLAPLPAPRVGPAPIFHSTAVDLFGPVYFSDMAK